jgi:hypothetical protein
MDYRVVNKDGWFMIHEVYYDENNKIVSWTENPVAPAGETIEDLRKELQLFLDALNKPVLIKDSRGVLIEKIEEK